MTHLLTPEARQISHDRMRGTYFVQQRNRGHLVKQKHVRLVEIVPAVQKLLLIFVSDLKMKTDKQSVSNAFEICLFFVELWMNCQPSLLWRDAYRPPLKIIRVCAILIKP